MTHRLVIGDRALTLADMRRLERPDVVLELAADARARIRAGAASLQTAMAGDALVYGVNTGSGPLAGQRIDADRLGELQRRLVLSNAVGVSAPLPPHVTRRVIALKLATIAYGISGVTEAYADALLAMVNAGVLPVIPAKGSCGASGDLAPLAHVGAALIGVGEVRVGDDRMDAAAGLATAGLTPYVLAPKEGLATVNGTQVSTALAVEGLLRTEDVFTAAVVAGAVSVEAGGGTARAFDSRIQDYRGQTGQRQVAAALRRLLSDSALQAAGGAGRIQDPYCPRCQPQVMGAALDQLRGAAVILEREMNGVSDNPLVSPDDGEMLYGGNFHAQPVGLAADTLAIALAEIGSMSKRRTAFLVDANMSGLPAFLVPQGGLDSGFMVAQVTAASLASENKALAHPGSVDSLPTAANQEDYVSMATYAARRLGDMAENARHVVAIELLAGCQGLEFRDPELTSGALRAVHGQLRRHVPWWDEDRYFAPDVAAAAALIGGDALPHLPDLDLPGQALATG